MYLYLMRNIQPLNEEVIKRHVDHLKALKRNEQLVLCGPFTDYPGGIVVLKATCLSEAIAIAEADPFIAEGYKAFEIRTLEEANEENNFLLAD